MSFVISNVALSLPLSRSLALFFNKPFEYTRLSINKYLQIKQNGKCCNAENWNSFCFLFMFICRHMQIFKFLLTTQKKQAQNIPKSFRVSFPARFAVVKNVS